MLEGDEREGAVGLLWFYVVAGHMLAILAWSVVWNGLVERNITFTTKSHRTHVFVMGSETSVEYWVMVAFFIGMGWFAIFVGPYTMVSYLTGSLERRDQLLRRSMKLRYGRKWKSGQS